MDLLWVVNGFVVDSDLFVVGGGWVCSYGFVAISVGGGWVL